MGYHNYIKDKISYGKFISSKLLIEWFHVIHLDVYKEKWFEDGPEQTTTQDYGGRYQKWHYDII